MFNEAHISFTFASAEATVQLIETASGFMRRWGEIFHVYTPPQIVNCMLNLILEHNLSGPLRCAGVAAPYPTVEVVGRDYYINFGVLKFVSLDNAPDKIIVWKFVFPGDTPGKMVVRYTGLAGFSSVNSWEREFSRKHKRGLEVSEVSYERGKRGKL